MINKQGNETLNNHTTLVKCPFCGSSNVLIYDDSNTIVCGNCGTILDENPISMQLESRFFSPQERITLKRTTSSVPLSELITKQFTIKTVESRLQRKADKEIISELYSERIIRLSRQILSDYINRLNLPAMVNKLALSIISQYIVKRKIREKNLPIFASAALFIASRKLGYPKPLDRILRVLGINKKEFYRAYKNLKETLNIYIEPLSAEKYVISFGRELGLSGKCIELAIKLIKQAKKRNQIIGRDSLSVAAAAVYYAALLLGEKRSQRRVASIAAITESTMRNRLKEIMLAIGNEKIMNL